MKPKKKIKFDPRYHYLGTLCYKKHEHENTGKSVRYKSKPHHCVVCEYERKVKNRIEDQLNNSRQTAICPKCGKEHIYIAPMPFIGRGTPRIFCSRCKEDAAAHAPSTIRVNAFAKF